MLYIGETLRASVSVLYLPTHVRSHSVVISYILSCDGDDNSISKICLFFIFIFVVVYNIRHRTHTHTHTHTDIHQRFAVHTLAVAINSHLRCFKSVHCSSSSSTRRLESHSCLSMLRHGIALLATHTHTHTHTHRCIREYHVCGQ